MRDTHATYGDDRHPAPPPAGPGLQGADSRGQRPSPRFLLPLATHPDGRPQLGYKPVVESPRHLRLQLVEGLVTVTEPLEAGGGRG